MERIVGTTVGPEQYTHLFGDGFDVIPCPLHQKKEDDRGGGGAGDRDLSSDSAAVSNFEFRLVPQKTLNVTH